MSQMIRPPQLAACWPLRTQQDQACESYSSSCHLPAVTRVGQNTQIHAIWEHKATTAPQQARPWTCRPQRSRMQCSSTQQKALQVAMTVQLALDQLQVPPSAAIPQGLFQHQLHQLWRSGLSSQVHQTTHQTAHQTLTRQQQQGSLQLSTQLLLLMLSHQTALAACLKKMLACMKPFKPART